MAKQDIYQLSPEMEMKFGFFDLPGKSQIQKLGPTAIISYYSINKQYTVTDAQGKIQLQHRDLHWVCTAQER